MSLTKVVFGDLILLEADPKSDLAVLEAGMSQFGEMERLAAMICPDGAIFTNIGDAHIGQLHTRENILQEKSFLVSGMKKDGFVILNGEDPLLTKEEVFSDFTRIYYGTDLSRMHPIAASHRRCYARDIRFLGGRTRFVAVLEEEEISVSLSVFGRHQVSNAMAALTAVKVLSGNVAAAAKKLEEFKGFAHRQQIFEKEGIQIIDDSYNASPDSMRAGIRLLRDLENGDRRIAVLGDMKELGPREIDRHKEIAVFIVEEGELDTLFTLGALAEHIGRELKSRAEARGKKYEVFPFFDKENLAAALKAYIKKGDAVLFKGSNSMGLFDIIEEVFYDNPFSHK